MPESIPSELMQAKSSFHPEEAVRHLTRAFALFSEEAAHLKSAYVKLQEKLLSVNQELAQKVTELNRLTSYLNNVLKNVSQGILFVNLDGTLTVMNEAAQKLLKVSQEAVLFKKMWDVFPDDLFGFPMKEALKFGLSHKLLYKSYEGKEFEISTTFVYEGPKPYHGLIVLFRDVSETQKLQLIVNRAHRMKELGEMAATLAHEIRNPLGGIRGYASLLYRDLKSQEHLQEMAGYVIEGTKNLEKLVTTVLQYARPVQVQPSSVELGSFLRGVAKFVKVDPAFPDSVKLQLHIPFDPLLAPIDPEMLKAALLNLIFNAIQAMPNGGALSLVLMKREASCLIEVSDTGIGMDEEQMAKLFSPFFTTKAQGTGIGLVEAQKIVQAHFGSIEARSQPGRGTTFTITLPLKR
ncbi:MAG: two-component sensor histidine kinase [Verrucomicrobia bacterium]|nr:two-component sensor histidine kinase [Verrucomicrobiota bacterium]